MVVLECRCLIEYITMSADGDGSLRLGRAAGYARLALAALLGFAFAWFVVQNGTVVEVSWLFFNTDAPLWAVVLASAMVGAILGKAIGWVSVFRSSRNNGKTDSERPLKTLDVGSLDWPEM